MYVTFSLRCSVYISQVNFSACSPVVQALQLQKQMHGLQLDRIMGSKTTTGAEHPYHTLCLRSLESQVKALQAPAVSKKKTAEGNQAAIYEIYTKTEAAKFSHLSKVGLRARGVVETFDCWHVIVI